MIPIPVPQAELLDDGGCALARRLKTDLRVVQKVIMAQRELPFRLQITSAWRSEEHQRRLKEQGYPAADPSVSNHCSCPSTALDLTPVGVTATDYVKALMGAAFRRAGLRWGGGSPVDPETGIPSDWVHVDLGPRASR